MKNLLARLFGSRPAPAASAASKPLKSEPAIETLRQRLLASGTADERVANARNLGQRLGQEGIDPAPDDALDVWIAALCSSAHKIQAMGWLDQLPDEEALEQVASSARLADIRLLAAERITDFDRLSHLAQRMRDKDRGVYRYCQEILKQHAEQVRRTELVDGLHNQLRQLVATRPIAPAQLYDLRKRLAAVPEGPDLQDCHALVRQAGEYEQEEAATLRRLDELAGAARTLLKTMGVSRQESIEQMKALAASLTDQLGSLPAWVHGHGKQQDVTLKLDEISSRLSMLEEEARRVAECRTFLMETAAEEVSQDLADAWNQLPKPDHSETRQALQADWLARCGHPSPRRIPKKPVKPLPMIDAEAFRLKLDQLDQALEAGASHQALTLARALDQMTVDCLPPQALASQYHLLQGRLGQVRDWARWSTQQARDKLLEEAEALTVGGTSRVHIAEAVPRLRDEWKRLDKLSRGSQAQWQQFEHALNCAYVPILAERAERNARQDAISLAKSALLDETEQWLQGLEADTINPAEVQGQRQALRNHWRGMAQAGPRDERRLQTRFHALMQRLDEKIQPHIQAEIDRRQRLLVMARQLPQEPDLRAAMDQARHLQQQWRAVSNLHLPRPMDEKLWRSFREAIDSVFARRDAERQQHEARHQERSAGRQAHLAELQTLLEAGPSQLQLDAGVARFKEQWDEEPPADGRRPRRDELDQQAEALLSRARTLGKQLRGAKQLAWFDLIEQKAAWATAWETEMLSGAEPGGEPGQRLLSLWKESESLIPELEQKLAKRFERASQVTPAMLDAGRVERSRLLLDLEILLDLPTSSARAEDRRARQLELLQTDYKALQHPSAILGLFGDWHAIAAMDEAEQGERISKVRDSLARLLAQ